MKIFFQALVALRRLYLLDIAAKYKLALGNYSDAVANLFRHVQNMRGKEHGLPASRCSRISSFSANADGGSSPIMGSSSIHSDGLCMSAPIMAIFAHAMRVSAYALVEASSNENLLSRAAERVLRSSADTP